MTTTKPRTRIRPRIRARLAATLAMAVAALSLTAFTTAASATVACDDLGTGGSWTWTTVASTWEVTHASPYEHFTPGHGEYSYTAAYQRTLTAGGSVQGEGSAGVDIGIAHLGAKLGVTLSLSGSETTSGSVSVSETMPKPGTYVFFAGNHRVSGSFTHTYCVQHTHVITHRGSVHSYESIVRGAVWCKSTPPVDSLAHHAKKFCR